VLAILEVYPAGEEPIQGADGRALCRAIRLRGKVDPVFLSDPERLAEVLSGVAEDGDILLLLGAGSIGRVAELMQFEQDPGR
jgi:UDP-N-acetylmuramate--alanine ligase